MFFNWRNHETIRAQAANPRFIGWDEHYAWFTESLSLAHRHIFIVVKSSVDVGYIRVEKLENWKELSWVVAPEYQGKGIGKEMLSKFMKQFPDRYSARIRNENEASLRVAKKAGFIVYQVVDSLTFVRNF